MDHRQGYRSLVIRELVKIMERPNTNTAFVDAREMWERVIEPLLSLEAEYWLKRFNGKDISKH